MLRPVDTPLGSRKPNADDDSAVGHALWASTDRGSQSDGLHLESEFAAKFDGAV